MGSRQINLPQKELVLCSVLRADLPLHQGLLNYFDKVENAFISAYRHHRDNQDAFEVIVKYLTTPLLANKVLVLTSPLC